MKNEHLEQFYEELESLIDEKLSGLDLTPKLDIDLEISPFYITPKFFSGLKKLEPFGVGNPQPVFLVRNVSILESRLVGNGKKHLKLSFETESGVFGGIAFGFGEEWGTLAKGDRVDVVFHLEENRWNGNTRLEWRVVDMRHTKE